MSRHSLLDLAQAGYQAYGDHVNWINHAGNAMPSWRELPATQREAWTAAAGAMARTLLTKETDGG